MLAYLDENPAPDAVIGLNDHIAIAAMSALQERGIRIPDEVKVAGFNGFDIINYVTPRLTTVRGSPFDVGAQAADIAITPDGTPVRRQLPTMLLRGETT